MWLKSLLSRPVSIVSFPWSMDSGRSSPTLKTLEAACMSTSAATAGEGTTKIASVPTPSNDSIQNPLRKSTAIADRQKTPTSSGVSKLRGLHRTRPTTTGSIGKRNMEPFKFRNLICTTGTERLTREFRDVKCAGMTQIRELKLYDNDLFHWKFLLLPDMAPYNKNAFMTEIKFPTSYPQMPPVITVHNIYHPNVDQKGFVCLHCLSHWLRTTKIEDVLQKLFALIRDPEPHHPMRFDVADEFLKDRKLFMHKAFEAAKALGVPRPKF